MLLENVRWEVQQKRYQMSLLEFGRDAFKVVNGFDYVHGRHAEVICRHLEALAHKDIYRLLMNLPPSCSKTFWAEVCWPAWVWTWWPECKIQAFSYNEALALRDQMACRDILASDWYRSYFPNVRVRKGHDQKKHFQLESGGERRIGIPGGSFSTGGHPDAIIGGDLISADRIESASSRASLKRWYYDTMSTRGYVRNVLHLLAFQRLHVEDLAGAILSKDKELIEAFGDSPWYHVMLPMRYDPDRKMEDRGFGGDWRKVKGELLFPELIDDKKVTALERTLGVHQANCQLEQNAKRRDGALFKVTRLIAITKDELPPLSSFDQFVRFWDLAGTDERENADACYTVGLLLGRIGGKYYVIDIVREQVGGDEVEDLLASTAALDHELYPNDKLVTRFEREGGSSGKIYAGMLCKRLRKYAVKDVAPKGNKVSRADAVATAVGRYEVYVVIGKNYNAFVDELTLFPGSTYKDQTDALSGAYNEMEVPTIRGKSPAVAPVRGTDGFPIMRDGEQACANSDCKRPAFSGEYCCQCCEEADQGDDVGEVEHKPRCNAQFSDWFNKR